jgi:hypothetical protein
MNSARSKTMKHNEIKEQLPDYLKDRLDKDTTAAIKTHLATCDDCTAELAFLKKYLKTTGTMEKTGPAPGFLQRVHARLEKKKTFAETFAALFSQRPVLLPLGAVGVLATALIVFLFTLPRQVHETSLVKAPATNFYMASAKPEGTHRSLALDKKVRDETAGGNSLGYVTPLEVKKDAYGEGMNDDNPVLISMASREEQSPSVPMSESKDMEADQDRASVKKEAEANYKSTAGMEKSKSSVRMMQSTAGMKQQVTSPVAVTNSAPSSGLFSSISNQIIRDRGRITAQKRLPDGTTELNLIIPSAHYALFLKDLQKLGDFNVSQPSLLPGAGTVSQDIHIRIRLP